MNRMRGKTYQEDIACFICDYWYLVLIILALLFWGIWLVRHLSPAASPIISETPAIETEEPAATVTPQPFEPTATVQNTATQQYTATPAAAATETPAPTPTRPVYIFGVIPVEWTGSDAEFEQLANRYVSYFVMKSGMDAYFEIQVQVLAEPDGLYANDGNILSQLTGYGMREYPADRYLGITSTDIVVDGEDSVVGYTMGDNAYSVISEAAGVEITAHELGHTYGLCDEYDYNAWTFQNEEMPQGCPNPLAASCSPNLEMCEGVPTENGENSMMGAAGYRGAYGFNTDCYDYLQQRFQFLVEGLTR